MLALGKRDRGCAFRLPPFQDQIPMPASDGMPKANGHPGRLQDFGFIIK